LVKVADDKKRTYAKVCGWCGLVASVFAFVIWIFHLISVKAFIRWNSFNFLADDGHLSWRQPIFTFAPSTLLDVWIPLLFCLMGLAIHFKTFPYRIAKLGESWPFYFSFHLLMAFFGGIGYGGNMGVILGALQFVAAVIIFPSVFICDEDAPPSLDLKLDRNLTKNDDSKCGKGYVKAVAWISLIASFLVVVVGVFRVCGSGAHIVWNKINFTSDTNKQYWRDPLFSVTLDVLADSWTPLVMGCIGCVFHLKDGTARLDPLRKNYKRFFVYHFVMGMVGCIGYAGNLGIIFSSVVFLACLLQLIAIFVCKDGVTCLQFSAEMKLKENNDNNVNVEAKI